MSLTDSPLAPVEEMIHGVLVRDPYRWLEDRSRPETEEWIREQQRRCDEYFAECEDLPAIRGRVREYLDVEVIDQPAKVGELYFYRKRLRGQEQGCIYVRDTTTGEERLLMDPSAGGPFTSIGIHRISDKGSLLAYERKEGGEDKKSIHVLDVKTGTQLAHNIESGYARGFVFASNGRGYFYCQEAAIDTNEHTIRLHLIDGATEDQIIFRVSRTCRSRLVLTADIVHLGAIWVHDVGGELLEDFWVAEQGVPEKWHLVCRNRTLPFTPILKDGRLFTVTHENAANGRVVEVDLSGQEMRTIVPEQETMLLQVAFCKTLILVRSVDGRRSAVRVWSLRGDRLPNLELPDSGTICFLPELGDGNSAFLSYESFDQRQTILEYVADAKSVSALHETASSFPSVSTAVEDAVYSSADGTRIPITILCPMPHEKGKPGPAIMTSYGGFGVSMTPQFSVFVAIMVELGATFAMPHIRGGGEFGKKWHDAARARSRQVSFNDFTAAAAWLCSKGITAPDRLGIFGGSNSGLLVGVAMTQRPELFRAVLCIAPLLDMVRYELFDHSSKWRDEYGTANDPQDFSALYAYSPYQHVEEKVDYPSVFFVSGDRDDRCNPAHVRKMVARLQEREAQLEPVLVDYSDDRGHSPVLPLSVRVDALARRIAFLCREMDITVVFGGRHEPICA